MASECPGTTIVTLETKRGTGNVLPSKFKAPQPNSSPTELFSPCAGRFVRHNNQKQVLVYVDGACANNGQPDPRGGWAVVPGPPANGQGTNGRVVSGRLENKGPFGDNSVATSNRAELRAVIAALRLCDWRLDGYDSLVVATDSSYVVDGATGWVKGWARNGWKTRNGGDVKNKDLWDLLLGEVERWKHKGLRICIWKIDRTLNTDADAAAKQACDGADKTEFGDVVIDSSQTATPTTGPSLHILALCLEYGSIFDECYKGLISQLTSKANFETVTTLDTAIAKLTQEAAPSIIIVADGAISRQRKLWERVIDCLRGGATVILGGLFSSMVNEGEFTRVFAKLGLPWKRGSYHREDVSLCHDVVGARLSSQLPSTYSQKALYVAGVERSSIWYLESEASQEAAVVFAKVGQGKLGYIGDVNGEEASEQVVLAMCGLLD